MNFKPLAGAALLAVGQGAAGMARFEGTVASFGASLAPLVVLPLVPAGMALAQGEVLAAITFVLLTVVGQLAPLVLSHWGAVRWGREAQWLRYATAFNWCQWVLPVMSFLVLSFARGPLPDEQAVAATLVIVGLYALWLNWVLARHGLDLGRWRAAGLVLGIYCVTAALVMLPQVLAVAVNGLPPGIESGLPPGAANGLPPGVANGSGS